MIAENFYIEKFLTSAEADRLLMFSLSLPPTRRVIQPWGNLSRFVSLGNFSEFPSKHHNANYGPAKVCLTDAPAEVKQLAATLSAFAGKSVNYISFNAYMNAQDGMNPHQHEEDRIQSDQSVWVVSLGAVRAVTLRPIGCTDRRQHETIYPAHGSLYILPSAYNTTHTHEVPSSKTPCGIRVGINCKSVAAPLQNSLFDLSAETAGPKIYDCHAGKKYPADAVYVGREVRDSRTGKVSWPATPFGNYQKLQGDAFRAYARDKMKDPEFRKQVESLRGKHLLCWCRPHEEENCHARIWLELANK
jgi:alkylated DNA repair dioxygenase AlkB